MSEYIDLYDADRQLIGQVIERNGEQAPDTYRMIVHVCIFNREDRMLIQKRATTKAVRPGFWDFSAGGGVSAGETCRIAAHRETYEELGLDIDFSDHRPIASFNFAGGFDDFFTVEIDSDDVEFVLQEEEVHAVKWADADEICAMIDEGTFLPFGKEMIRYLFVAREGKGSWKL